MQTEKMGKNMSQLMNVPAVDSMTKQVIVALSERNGTAQELSIATGLRLASVETVLQRLKKKGIVQRNGALYMKGRRGKAPSIYMLNADRIKVRTMECIFVKPEHVPTTALLEQTVKKSGIISLKDAARKTGRSYDAVLTASKKMPQLVEVGRIPGRKTKLYGLSDGNGGVTINKDALKGFMALA